MNWVKYGPDLSLSATLTILATLLPYFRPPRFSAEALHPVGAEESRIKAAFGLLFVVLVFIFLLAGGKS